MGLVRIVPKGLENQQLGNGFGQSGSLWWKQHPFSEGTEPRMFGCLLEDVTGRRESQLLVILIDCGRREN